MRRESLIDAPERRAWIVDRLQFLAELMAIDVISFAVMRNHVHLLLSIRPDIVASWTDREVAWRRVMLQPKRRWRIQHGIDVDAAPTESELQAILLCPQQLTAARRYLSNLGSFHRLLKEPCARLWNRLDRVKGHFWEGRFESRRVLDPQSLVHVSRYVELNEVYACAADSLPSSVWSSAAWQWRRLREVIEECLQTSSGDLCPKSVADRICSIHWQPVFPCRTDSRSDPTQDAARPTVRSTDALCAVHESQFLVAHLDGVHRIGAKGRIDKRGRIRAGKAPPLVAAFRAAFKRCRGALRDAGAAVGAEPNFREARGIGEFIERAVDEVTQQIHDAKRSWLGTHLTKDDSALGFVVTQGSCYGHPEALQQEASRRGRARVRSGFKPKVPPRAA